MTPPTFVPRTDIEERPPFARITTTFFLCVSCQELATVDVATKLCRPCWRVVVLGAEVAAATAAYTTGGAR